MVIDAAYPLARDRLSFLEHEMDGLMPHAVRELWLFASTQPDTFVDIGASFERKVSVRVLHESQTIDSIELAEQWRARAAEIGAPVGLQLAEAFKCLTLD